MSLFFFLFSSILYKGRVPVNNGWHSLISHGVEHTKVDFMSGDMYELLRSDQHTSNAMQ